MKQIKLTIQYDGTAYSGWQAQPDALTIQGVIEDTLLNIAPDRSRIIAAGRTDAGVHALDQVATFRSATGHPPKTIQKALNASLPHDIRIVDATYCDDRFHPRFDARKKTYIYIISAGKVSSPFLSRYTWHIYKKLNVGSMKKAATVLIGRHDFSSFQASGCAAKNPIRDLCALDIKRTRSIAFLGFKLRGDFLVVTTEANAFLRHMVRNIVGTLTEVGKGTLSCEEIHHILSLRDRNSAGPTAPARGLFLTGILY